MKIAFIGAHPLMEAISTRLARHHRVVAPTWADVIIVGGYSNSLKDKFIYPFNKPTILLSSYLVYAGANHTKAIDEDVCTSIHPLADLSASSLNYLIREKTLLDKGNTTVLRIFPVCGAHTSYMDKLCTKALNKEVSINHRLGWRTRSYLHIDDLINSIELVLSKKIPGLYNIGSEESITTQELTTLIWKSAKLNTDNSIDEEWVDLPWRPTKMIPSTDRFKVTFDWQPNYTLTKSIKFILNNEI